jgi:tRNA 2-thiouridine synthesizing protein A
MPEASEILNVDTKIDCIGLFCPMPVVKIREAIARLRPGQVCEMLADDPGAEADMKAWARRTGHELVHLSRHEGIFRFVVRKTG